MSVEAGWRVDVTPLILGLETSVHFAVTQGEIHALVETLGVVTHHNLAGQIGAAGGIHSLPTVSSPVWWDDSEGELSRATGAPEEGHTRHGANVLALCPLRWSRRESGLSRNHGAEAGGSHDCSHRKRE